MREGQHQPASNYQTVEKIKTNTVKLCAHTHARETAAAPRPAAHQQRAHQHGASNYMKRDVLCYAVVRFDSHNVSKVCMHACVMCVCMCFLYCTPPSCERMVGFVRHACNSATAPCASYFSPVGEENRKCSTATRHEHSSTVRIAERHKKRPHCTQLTASTTP